MKNNQSRKRFSKKSVSPKTTGRVDQRDIGLNDELVGGPDNPPPVRKDLTVRAIRRAVITPTDPDTAVIITPTIIWGMIPGGSTGSFDRFRIIKITAYGPSDDNSGVSVSSIIDTGAYFEDVGVPGNTRPRVSISPHLALRQRWFTNSTGLSDALFTVSAGDTQAPVLLDLTLEMWTAQQSAPERVRSQENNKPLPKKKQTP